jgi:hypothetical protein
MRMGTIAVERFFSVMTVRPVATGQSYRPV